MASRNSHLNCMLADCSQLGQITNSWKEQCLVIKVSLTRNRCSMPVGCNVNLEVKEQILGVCYFWLGLAGPVTDSLKSVRDRLIP